MKMTTSHLTYMQIILLSIISMVITLPAFSQANSQGFIQTAYNAMKAKNYPAAIENYSKAISAFDSYAPAYYGRGLAHFNNDELQMAKTNFEKAVELQPNYFEAYYALGMIEMRQDKYQQAVSYFDKCLSLTNAFPEAHYARASSWYQMKNYDKALVDYNKTIQLQPSYALAYYGRAITKKQNGMKAQAIDDFAKYKDMAGDQHGLAQEVDRLMKETSSTIED